MKKLSCDAQFYSLRKWRVQIILINWEFS